MDGAQPEPRPRIWSTTCPTSAPPLRHPSLWSSCAGDFNDASGKPMTWEVATGKVGADLAASVFAARPEMPGHTWSVLDLPSPQASP